MPVARGNTLTPRSNASSSCTPGTSGFVVQLKYPIAACGLLQPSEHLRPYFSRACPQDISAPDYHLSAQPVIYAWSTPSYRIILIREFIADIHLEIVISLTDRSSLHTHTLLHIVSRQPATRYEKSKVMILAVLFIPINLERNVSCCNFEFEPQSEYLKLS